MITHIMELTPEEYQTLFIELIRASKAIYSRMNVKDICEISLDPERRLTDDEMETFRISYRCPLCKQKTVETLNSECDGANEIVYYGCSNCKIEFSMWKEPVSGRLLGGK
jgi:transposase-like protein